MGFKDFLTHPIDKYLSNIGFQKISHENTRYSIGLSPIVFYKKENNARVTRCVEIYKSNNTLWLKPYRDIESRSNDSFITRKYGYLYENELRGFYHKMKSINNRKSGWGLFNTKSLDDKIKSLGYIANNTYNPYSITYRKFNDNPKYSITVSIYYSSIINDTIIEIMTEDVNDTVTELNIKEVYVFYKKMKQIRKRHEKDKSSYKINI